MNDFPAIDPSAIGEAYFRIKPYIKETPIVSSETLNDLLGADIFFKIESFQKTGAFKVRGVLNRFLELGEKGALPKKAVAYSTGNHGIGLAYAGRLLNMSTRIYLPKNTSPVKKRAAEYYGAEVIEAQTRAEAEARCYGDGRLGFYYTHPSDSDTTIAGAGTACYEALKALKSRPDAIFASCGGGGLLSGSYLAKELLSPSSLLIGSEPEKARDAFLSLRKGSVVRLDSSPDTVADGLRALGLSERTFSYVKKLDGLYTVKERAIYYWTAWLIHLLKIACEPSAALNMETVKFWLKENRSKARPKLLVIISGGNIDPTLYRDLWKEDYLIEIPSKD